eukprot:3480827-Amphidinium_carterae.1
MHLCLLLFFGNASKASGSARGPMWTSCLAAMWNSCLKLAVASLTLTGLRSRFGPRVERVASKLVDSFKNA